MDEKMANTPIFKIRMDIGATKKTKLTCARENASNSFEALVGSIAKSTDHTGDVFKALLSISSRASIDRSPVRKAMSTASTAAGTSSTTLLDVLIAAAAKDPIHRPTTALSEPFGYGLDPCP